MALRKLVDLVEVEDVLRSILRVVSFARDSSDRMRVVVDSGAVNTVVASGSNMNAALGAAYYAPYSQYASNIHDIREQYMNDSLNVFNTGPRARWTIT